jgi:hypothetical protein
MIVDEKHLSQDRIIYPLSPTSMGPQTVSTRCVHMLTYLVIRILVGLPRRKSDENMMDRQLVCLETGRSSG